MADKIEWDSNELTALAESFTGDRVSPAITKAIKDGGEAIAKRAKTLAPKRSGKMRRSISSELKVTHGGTDVSAEIGPTVFYGRFLEHGTAKMAAHPFLAPAADSLADEIAESVAEAAGKALE